MSNILVLFSQPILDAKNPKGIICFYESFISELRKNSNNVKCVNIYSINNVDFECISNIKQFNPDIIFAFNNRITESIIKNTDCPICIMNADGLDMWSNVHLIKQYIDRYYLFSFWHGWEQTEYENLGLDKKHIASLHMATSIHAKCLEKTANISFIGSVFMQPSKQAAELYENNAVLRNDAQQVLYNGNIDFDKFFERYKSDFNNDILQCYPLFDPRLFILNSVTDLGLDLYGLGWDKLPDEYMFLKSVYKKQPICTLDDNERIYNSSHVNISISHPQCKGYAFPWRVFDIMASNGLLISSYSGLLEKMTKGHVKIPMYKSPYVARDLCKYALENPKYCKDIIAASNEFIEKKARWDDNLQKIQEITKTKIINKSQKKHGDLDIICIVDKSDVDKSVKNTVITGKKSKIKKFFNRLAIKKRAKLFFYSFLLTLAQIPILDLLQRSKTRIELRRKIDKWWR